MELTWPAAPATERPRRHGIPNQRPATAEAALKRVPWRPIRWRQGTKGPLTASFAALGDCIVAEPGAVVGFAGPRLIEQATGERLPPGADTAEFQLKHGMVDIVALRRDLRQVLARMLRLFLDAVGRAQGVRDVQTTGAQTPAGERVPAGLAAG